MTKVAIAQDTKSSTKPPIVSLAFSPDATQLLAASQAGVEVLDWPKLNLVSSVESESPNIRCVAFAPSGDVVAIGGGAPALEGLVELRSWPEMKRIKTLRYHSDSVTDVVWLDENTIATSALDNEVVIWNVQSGKPINYCQGHSRGVTSLSWIGNHDQLVSTGIDQSLRVWQVKTGKLVRSLRIHTRPIHALALRPNVNGLPMVASASDDRSVRFWQPTIGRMVRFARLASVPLAVTWTNDGQYLLAACKDGKLRVVDPDTVEVVETLGTLSSPLFSIAMHPSEKTAVVGSTNGKTTSFARLEIRNQN